MFLYYMYLIIIEFDMFINVLGQTLSTLILTKPRMQGNY
jgi:hypothetical protein